MALIDLLKIINHQVTTVKGRTPITGYELNRILNEIAVFADSGGGGGGDMDKATYDPALILEQLVGLTAIQILTNKTINGVVLNSGGAATSYLDATGSYSVPPTGGGGDLAATLTLGEDANAGQDVILHDTGKFILDDDQVAPVSSNLELSINASQALIETTGVAGASRILTLKSNQPGSGIHLETGAIRIGSVANHNISIAGVTGSRTAILQDSDGTIAYLSDITGGSGDMLAATYDPTGIGADAFDKANEIGIEQVTGAIITPPTLTGNVNDYNPTDFATSNMIRQDIDANNRQITGFVAPSAGVDRIIYICNINAGTDDIKFMDNDPGSVAANRILLRDSGDKALKANETAAFWYDHTSLRWRPYNRIG